MRKLSAIVFYRICLVLMHAFLFWNAIVFGTDLGVIGQVFPIVEPDLLQQIKSHLSAMQKNGELDRKMAEFNQPHAINVTTVHDRNIQEATSYHKRLFDPTVILSHDLHDPAGHIIAHAGTRINPLSHRQLGKPLLFFDGSQASQLAWVEQYLKQKRAAQLILVGGDVDKASLQLKKHCYADMTGALTERFKLKVVPALLTQVGDELQIEEFVP